MFEFNFIGTEIYLNRQFIIILCVAIFFSFFAVIKGVENWQMKLFTKNKTITAYIIIISIALILVIISVGSITSSGFNPFIYFRF